jgi:fatty-acyl-CoA synthase
MRGPAFSTLACPDWSLERALAAGREYGYRGVELRLVDGNTVEPPISDAETKRVARLLASSGLEVVALDSSIRLTDGEPAEVAARIGASVEQAVAWGAPLVRVFGGGGDPGQAVAALGLAGPRAERAGIKLGLETHDSFSASAAVGSVLDQVDSASVGAVWDVVHTYRLGDTPTGVVLRLGSRIFDVHVKDARRAGPNGDWEHGFDYVLLGEGEVPVSECLDALRAAGYTGWVVAEWEKKWHPELAEPEVALPQHARVLEGWLNLG